MSYALILVTLNRLLALRIDVQNAILEELAGIIDARTKAQTEMVTLERADKAEKIGAAEMLKLLPI